MRNGEMLRKYKKLQKQEKKILKKESPTEDDMQDLFNIRQDMAAIMDFIEPSYYDTVEE